MPARFTIELASPADADAAAALHHLSHTQSFAAFASPEWVASRRAEDYRSQWRAALGATDPKSGAWVARAEGQVVGVVRVTPMAESGLAQLISMHVHPDFQGRGIGRALMQSAEDFIKERGYQRAILGVIQANNRALRLYESSGWAILEEHPTGVEGMPVAIYGKRFD